MGNVLQLQVIEVPTRLIENRGKDTKQDTIFNGKLLLRIYSAGNTLRFAILVNKARIMVHPVPFASVTLRGK